MRLSSMNSVNLITYRNKFHINIIFIVRERLEYVIAKPKR